MSREIKDIASDPDEHYAIEADSYNSLKQIKDIVKQCICMAISKELFTTYLPYYLRYIFGRRETGNVSLFNRVNWKKLDVIDSFELNFLDKKLTYLKI